MIQISLAVREHACLTVYLWIQGCISLAVQECVNLIVGLQISLAVKEHACLIVDLWIQECISLAVDLQMTGCAHSHDHKTVFRIAAVMLHAAVFTSKGSAPPRAENCRISVVVLETIN